MRDLFLIIAICGSLPLILARPIIGVFVWCWISYMNPHRLTWGYVYDFPIAMLVASATFISFIISPEKKRLPATATTVLLFALVVWFSITTMFALAPDTATDKWENFMKIQFMTFIPLFLLNTRERLQSFIWIIAISIGFYSVKGGAFSVLSGGVNHVFGPPESFIADNNSLALAFIVMLPLMRYLQLTSEALWIRRALGAAMILSVFAIIGSQSRGALVGGIAMGLFLLMKSRRKLPMGLATIGLIVAAAAFVPATWIQRMETIEHYEEDESAMGRIEAWTFATKLAVDRPITGGGFAVIDTPGLFERYMPGGQVRNFHSNYFEVLGEHGFVGLAIFLSLLMAAFVEAGRAKARANRQGIAWARDLAAMLQVSLVGYAVTGAFLNLAIFDLYYHLLVIIANLAVITRAPAPDPIRKKRDAMEPVASKAGLSPSAYSLEQPTCMERSRSAERSRT